MKTNPSRPSSLRTRRVLWMMMPARLSAGNLSSRTRHSLPLSQRTFSPIRLPPRPSVVVIVVIAVDGVFMFVGSFGF